MKKNLKFLIIGALMTGVVSMAQAHNDHVTEDVIKSSITNIVKKQFDKGLFSEKSDISIKLVEPTKVTITEKDNTVIEKEEYDLSENHSIRLSQHCKVNLSFDKFGNTPYLGHDDQLMNVTKFQNERQKDMARQFVALHEQSHCEFGSINNPVLLKNASKDIVARSNYLLKDMEVMNVDWGHGGSQLNYVGTVNESYADVSAMMLMIKEYGINDSDLKFVLKAVEVQRNDNYLQKGAEEHDTHIAIKKLFEKENLEKVEHLNDIHSFQQLALEIANDGVQNLLTQRKDFTEKTFTQENFAFSVMVNLVRLTKKEILTNEEKENFTTTIWKEGVESGITYEIAKEILKEVDLKKYNFDLKNPSHEKMNASIIDFASEVMNDPVNVKIMEKVYEHFKEITDIFKEQMYKNHETKLTEFDSKATKDEVMKRVGTLRSQFIQATKNKSNTITPN